MLRILSSLIAAGLLSLTCQAHAASAACPPEGWTLASLQALKARQFDIPDDAERQALGNGLLACLDDPNPVLRDGIAYEAYATWLRSDLIAGDTIADWSRTLLAWVQRDEPDPQGIRRPFAALVLSELARTDRVKPNFSDALRAEMAGTAATYLTDCRDYRGFEPSIGWRHGVAHSADWIMQLSLNEQIPVANLTAFQQALLSQVTAHGQYAYVDGESERLARAVLMLMHRTELNAESWRSALAALAQPETVKAWPDAFGSRSGLNERHNLRLFLYALEQSLRQTKLPDQQTYLDAIQALLKATA